jgi:hypothetical protein
MSRGEWTDASDLTRGLFRDYSQNGRLTLGSIIPAFTSLALSCCGGPDPRCLKQLLLQSSKTCLPLYQQSDTRPKTGMSTPSHRSHHGW